MKPKRDVDSGSDALDTADEELRALKRRHLRTGWTMLLCFLGLGLALESLHGWKVDWYLNAANDTRRLMFTLAHAHGTLIGLLHLAFGASAAQLLPRSVRAVRAASRCFSFGGLLLPLGFLLGGVFIHAGDPGVGVFLVPVGALALLVGVGLCARTAWGSD